MLRIAGDCHILYVTIFTDVCTKSTGRRWAFTLSNAGAVYTEFRKRLNQLGEINWAAVGATDFRDPAIKEGKQAEFLLQGFFPWELVRRIGVHSVDIQRRVSHALTGTAHRPPVEICPAWYF